MSTPTRPGGAFHPRTMPSKGRRTLVLVFGPLLWLIGLFVTAVAQERSGMIAIAALIAGAALLIAFFVLLPGAIKRQRRLNR